MTDLGEAFISWILEQPLPGEATHGRSDGPIAATVSIRTDRATGTVNVYDLGQSTPDIVEFRIVRAGYEDDPAFHLHFELLDLARAQELFGEMLDVFVRLEHPEPTKVLLCCSGGLTTTMFADALTRTAKSFHQDYVFEAKGLERAIAEGDEGYGCVLLTYNNVLKMDLQRLVSFFPASSDARNNLSIQTIHSYLYSLAATLGADNGLNGLKDHVDRLWKRNGRRAFAADSALDLDKILLIDEAQDCTPDEKEIFEKVFGRDNVIVAKSAWQKVRRQSVAKWGRPTVRLSVGLRQKANIVQFLKTLAGEMGISDTCAGCDPAPGLVEGKVMILQD